MTLSCDARAFIKVNNSKELLVFGFEGNKFYDRQYNWEENWKAKMIYDNDDWRKIELYSRINSS